IVLLFEHPVSGISPVSTSVIKNCVEINGFILLIFSLDIAPRRSLGELPEVVSQFPAKRLDR
ncbi:MAG: hypothetical protein WAN04_06600, partial [Candidatus Udaeobacter sp.]